MPQFKDNKVEELIKHKAAEFLQLESSGLSLITVTGIEMTDRMTKAIILISVLPDDKQDEALDFAKRKRTEFREYLKEHTKMRRLPFVDFRIDFGEKNRQRIDELSSGL